MSMSKSGRLFKLKQKLARAAGKTVLLAYELEESRHEENRILRLIEECKAFKRKPKPKLYYGVEVAEVDTDLTRLTRAEIDECRNGNYIWAIKSVRERTHLGLKESKDLVDLLRIKIKNS